MQTDHAEIFRTFLETRRAKHGDATMTGPTPPTPPEPPAPTPPTPPAPPASDRTFTQADIDGIVTREKNQARSAAETALLQQLGVGSVEDAKKVLEQAETARQAQLTEAQRQQEAATAAQAAADKAAADARQLGLQYQIDSTLLSQGVFSDGTPEGDQRVAYIRGMVNVAPGADATAIKAKVDEVRTLFPQLFTPASPPQQPPFRPFVPSPPSDPSGRPPANQPATGAMERGMARAKARMGNGDAPPAQQ